MNNILNYFKNNDESINDFIKNLYEDMKNNTSFIDYEFTVEGKTNLYKTFEKHKNDKIIQPDFLKNIDFHEYKFQEIRYLKLYEVMVPHEVPGVKMQNGSGIFKMEFSVYYCLKK